MHPLLVTNEIPASKQSGIGLQSNQKSISNIKTKIMKKITTTFVLLLSCLFMMAQDKIYVHVATPANIDGHRTVIDHPDLNGNPSAPIVFTQVWNINGIPGVYNDNQVALDYWAGGSRWIIFNENGTAMPENAKFNIYIADDSEVYTHTATSGNTTGGLTDLNIAGIGQASFVFHCNFWDAAAPVNNPHPYGTYWFGGERGLYREDGGNIPLGAKFKVMRGMGPSSTRISHVSTAANIAGHWTSIDHPLLNGNPNATFIYAHYWGFAGGNTVDLPHFTGAWYTGTHWAIFNQDFATFPEDVLIDIIIADQEVLSTNEFESVSVTVFPNPVVNELSIQSQTVLESIEIYNILGQLVYEKSLSSSNERIDLSQLSSGQYIAKIATQEGTLNKKIIKK
jgi:hypothetical protein